MKAYQKYGRMTMLTCLIVALVLMGASCASRQKNGSLADVENQASSNQPPSTIELSNTRLSDALQEGDIPEEDRNTLPWLPKRPPQGMQFESTTDLQTVYFEFDKFSLTSEARRILNHNAEWLKAHPDVSIQIAGHCDERGTLEYNQVLGENRAIAVKKYLTMLGINPDQVYTISYGETRPADPGHNEEAWAMNRRAEFKIGY